MEPPAAFVELLRRRRQAIGLTQEELAERARLSWRAVSDIERGIKRPRKDTVTLLGEALGLAGAERAAFEAAARRPIAGFVGDAPLGDEPATPMDRRVVPLPAGMLTFLIADVRGYTAHTHQHGDEAGAALATHFAALAGEVVTAHEGLVVEIRGDEVLAVFTSARRALRAAVDLLRGCAAQATPELPLRAGVGLDVGEPITVPGGYRGEVINVAARLCAKAAPGEVLASDAVVSLARRIDGLTYEERGPLELKGISRPVRAWLVRAEPVVGVADDVPSAGTDLPASAPPLTPLPRGRYLGAAPENRLVGREGEMARLEAALTEAGTGHGKLLLLAGEPGVGKTRLGQEAMVRAGEAGYRTVTGRCYEEHGGVPFYPFREALTRAWELADPALQHIAGIRYAALGRLLPDLLPVPPVEEGEEARLRVLRAVEGFLGSLAAEQPLLLLLDDLHWADGASLELLRHLARAAHGLRLLVLGTYRDVEVGRRHPLEATLTHLLRERLVEVISLRTLSAEGTAALIGAHFNQTEVSAELRDAIHARTEGNPFFTEEVLSALVEAGAIYREGASWERRAMDEILLPQSVKAVVGQRVGRLTLDAQELLRTACVLGQEFELDVLLPASGQEESVVLDGLDAALQARLLEERRGGRGERYAFAHALIGQVLYDEAPRHRLRRLHVRAGEALARARGEQAAAEVARHFLAGGAEECALPYLERAGDHAMALYAHDEAHGHYQTAVDLLDEAGDQSGLAAARRRLAGALARLRRTAEAVALYEQALAYYAEREDRAEQAAVAYEIGMTYRAVNDYSAALPHLETALRLWPEDYQPARAARLYMNLALLRLLESVPQAAAEAMPLVDRGLALAEQLGDLTLRAYGLGVRANIAGAVGGRWAGGAVYEPVMHLARQSGDRETLLHILNWRGMGRRDQGELRAALQDFQERLALAVELGLVTQIFGSRQQIAETCFDLGEWAEARAAQHIVLALEPAKPLGMMFDAWLQGDQASAIALIERELDRARERHDLAQEILMLAILAEFRFDMGQAEEALNLTHRALTLDPPEWRIPYLRYVLGSRSSNNWRKS